MRSNRTNRREFLGTTAVGEAVDGRYHGHRKILEGGEHGLHRTRDLDLVDRSGQLPTAIDEAKGAAVGVMHPMVSFPSKSSSPSLRGATFAVNGDRKAVAVSRKIAAACGARVLVARTGDPAYHAAAALTANGAVALAYASVSALQSLGIERRAAERAIGGLLETVGQNVQRLGVPAALTGPVARGEAKTIAKHRSALRKTARDTLRSYDSLVPLIVDCARAAGLSRAKANAILRTLER